MDNRIILDHPIKFIYPLPFNDFLRIRSAEKLDYTVKDYHQIFKLKRILQKTQKKIVNRINLFKKASQKIVRERFKENLIVSKLQSIKKNTHAQSPSNFYFNNDISQTNKVQPDYNSQQQILSNNTKNINIKFNNAKNIKMQKQKYREIIASKRNDQMRKNLKSAENVRKGRQIAKLNKLELERQKKQQYNKFIQQKVKRQKQTYLQLEQNLELLQIEEKQALINWKKTLDCQ